MKSTLIPTMHRLAKRTRRLGAMLLPLAVATAAWAGATTGGAEGVQGLQFYAGITCTGTVGVPYQLQYTTNLQDPAGWMTLTNVLVDTNRLFFVDLDSPQSAARFYRLVRLPTGTETASTPLSPTGSAPGADASLLVSNSRRLEAVSPTERWRELTDPDHDCKVQVESGTVNLEIPGTAHDFAAELGIWNAPRLLTQVTGDFVLEVHITGDFEPGGGSTISGRRAYNGAGLLLVQDNEHHLSLQRGAVNLGDHVYHYANFELRQGADAKVINREFGLEPNETFLRLARRGNKFLAMASQDGSNWRAFNPLTVDFPETLSAGVEAINSSKRPFACSFRQLALYREVTNSSVAGRWSWSAGHGKYSGKLELAQAADGRLTGHFLKTPAGGEGTIEGMIVGNVVQFTRRWTSNEQTYSLTLNAQGTSLTGTLGGNFDRAAGDDFTGTRE